jgi:hypothetical protein
MIKQGLQNIATGKTYEYKICVKSFFKIVLTALITLLLLSSGTAGRNLRNVPFQEMRRDFACNVPTVNFLLIKADTSAFIKLVRIDSFRLPILPPSSGVQFYKDKIVFLSMSKNERRMSENQISFGAIEAYIASYNDSITGTHEIFSQSSSFTSPCEAMTFSHDNSTIYLSKLSKKDKKEKIFMAEFSSKGLVIEKSPLDFCTGEYNYSHPALSSDDALLVFASDKDGSYGGMDLFLSRKSGGKWTSPENLGKSINTTGNEFFPFLDSDNNLYFSSDGLKGYGGYDLFTCKFNGTGWGKPKNLGNRINSVYDDIALTINRVDGKTAFLTRRKSLKAYEMQLFRLSLKEDAANLNLVTVFNGNPVLKTAVTASNATLVKTKPETELVIKKAIKRSGSKAGPKKTEIKEPAKKSSAKISSTEVNTDASKAKPAPAGQKDGVVYRVQILPGAGEKNSGEMRINGTGYKLYEYMYKGANRYTIGEFTTLSPAIALQRICRQSGYPTSFVVAFMNNVRSLDPGLFK